MSQPAPTLAELRAAIEAQGGTAAAPSLTDVVARQTPIGPPLPAVPGSRDAYGSDSAPAYAAQQGPPKERLPTAAEAAALVDAVSTPEGNPGITEIKRPIRAGLDVVSGGATEAVGAAVAGAGDKAKKEVDPRELERLSPAARAQLMALANPGSQLTLVRTPSGWVPSTETRASGATGKDPESRAEALRQQGLAEERDIRGLEFAQDAETKQTGLLQEIQQNEMRATQEFKRAGDELDDRYNTERETQIARLKGIQTAMDAVPNAPRTIGEKLKQGGIETKLQYGIAALFAVGASGLLKDGGKSGQTLVATLNDNIDRMVKKEQDEFARYGDRAKISDNIYAHLRQGMQDDRAALNVTKALYYDAAMNSVEQIALQYKMDMHAPQIQGLLSHLARERQKLVMDSAATMQEQISNTDKYQQGGVVAIGGGAKKMSEADKDTEGGVDKFGKLIEERGGNSASRSIDLYQRVIDSMQGADMDRKDKFTKAYLAAISGEQTYLGKATQFYIQSLDAEDQKVLQDITAAGNEMLKDQSGKAVTANELARDITLKGAFSINSLDRVRDQINHRRRQIFESANAQAGGPTTEQGYGVYARTYIARMRLGQGSLPTVGIGSSPKQAIDPEDLSTRVEGRLKQ